LYNKKETNDTVANLFTKGSHHRNVSVVYWTQNLFPKKQICQNNEHKCALFKNPRDATHFANLARQMYPKRLQFAIEAYEDATRERYSYLLFDLRPEQDDLRHISWHYIYIAK